MGLKVILKHMFRNNSFIKKIYGSFIKKRESIHFEKRKKEIDKNGLMILCKLEEILESSGLTYFATCGTLLGLVREGRLLRHDYDMDYAVLIEKKEDWLTLENTLLKYGFRKIRMFTLDDVITEQTYRSGNGIEIDFFGHFIIDDSFVFYSYDKLENFKYQNEEDWSVYILNNGSYKGVKTLELHNCNVSIPVNAEEYLTYNYNDDWRIPNPNFKANTGKGCKLLKDKIGKIHIF